MAHAYETIAHGGRRVSGTLAKDGAPVAIQEVAAGGRPLPDGQRLDKNRVRTTPVLPADVAQTETSMLETVLQYGTARAAAIGQFAAGKTGTTTNFGDAWFVGWDSKYTVAVWVGYPDKLIPMTTEFNGGPVFGGTFPALIWHDFMTSALQIDKARAEQASVGQRRIGQERRPLHDDGPRSEHALPHGRRARPWHDSARRGQSEPDRRGQSERNAAHAGRRGKRSRRRGSQREPRTRRRAADARARSAQRPPVGAPPRRPLRPLPRRRAE